MKNLGIKISGMALVMIVMAVLMTSCQKDNSFVNETVEPAVEVEYLANSLRVYYDNGGEDYGCKGSGGNCLKTVVITASRLSAYNELFDAVGGGNVQEIKHTIEHNFEIYAQDIQSSHLEKVMSDDLRLTSKDFDQNEVRYFIFSNHAEENVAVYPMR